MAPARTSSGVVLHRGSDHADLTPLTVSTVDGFDHDGDRPVASSTMLADRNGKSARSLWRRMRSIPKSNSWLP